MEICINVQLFVAQIFLYLNVQKESQKSGSVWKYVESFLLQK